MSFKKINKPIIREVVKFGEKLFKSHLYCFKTIKVCFKNIVSDKILYIFQ